jgi:hypothetical protein
MSLNGTVGYQRSFFEVYKASVNVNLNWSKFNVLRANPADPTNPAIEFYTNNKSHLELQRGHLGHNSKFGHKLRVGYSLRSLNGYQIRCLQQNNLLS